MTDSNGKWRCRAVDKALTYLALARKAGLAELGEEPAAQAAHAGRAQLVVVASDASDHTWRRAKSLVSGSKQQLIRLPYTKDDMGFAIGRTSLAIAAITDAGIAKSLVESLGQPEQHSAIMEALQQAAFAAKRKHSSSGRPGKGSKCAKQKH